MTRNASRLGLVMAMALVGGLFTVAPAGAAADWHVTESTVLTQDFYGMIIVDADDVTLDCAGFSVYPDGVNYQNGIYLSGVNRVTVTNCVVDGGAMNIYAEYGEDLHFIGNTVLNAVRWDGLRIQFTDRVVIEDNYAEGNARQGFAAWYDVDARWTANTAIGNGVEGISLGFTTNAIVTGNTATGHSEIGFASHGSAGSYYEGNTATHNRLGFGMSAQTDLTLVANNANRNTEIGFALHHNSGVTYTRNKATGNGTAGFYTSLMDNVVMTDNSAVNNGAEGFALWDSTSFLIDGNTARKNFHGILLGRGSDHMVTNNVIAGSDLDGLIVHATTNSTVSGNSSDRNGKFGFSASDGAAGNTFSLNTACRNGELDAIDSTDGLNVWTDDNDFCTTLGL